MRKGYIYSFLAALTLLIVVVLFFKIFNDIKSGRDTPPVSSETTFSFLPEEQYFDDPVFGEFPGVKEFNDVATEYYKYIGTKEGMLEVQEVYKFFVVQSIVDRDKNILELRSDSGISTYLMECDREKTFAHRNINQVFISANFEFIEAVSAGDLIATKCKDAQCTVLGPECILIKN